MITEGFDPSVCAPTLGGFSVRFKPGTESKLLGPHVAETTDGNGIIRRGGRVENWGQDSIYFTPTRLANPTAASVKASALFAGRCDKFAFGVEGNPWTLSGTSILAWMGTADGISPGLRTTYTAAAPYTGTLADYLLAQVVAVYHGGLDYDATTVTATALNVAINGNDSLREQVIQLTQVAEAEFFCHPSGTVEWQDKNDTAGTVFTWTPTVIFGDGIQSGREAGMVGYQSALSPTFDFTNQAATVRMTNSAGTSGSSFRHSPTLRYPRLYGGASASASFSEPVKFLGADDETFDQYAGTGPFTKLDAEYLRRDMVPCEVDAPMIRRECKPGDWVYLISERTGIIDTANAVNYGGRTLVPQKRRVTGLDYPITEGMGVYVHHDLSNYDSGAVQDVTEDVMWETGTTTVSLDTTAPKSLRRAVLGTQHRPTWRKA